MALGRVAADLVVRNIGQLVTVAGQGCGCVRDRLETPEAKDYPVQDRGPAPRTGQTMGALGVIDQAAVAVSGEGIVWVGPDADLDREVAVGEHTRVVDAAGRCVLPGLVDPHTHLVYAGSREGELGLKLREVPYLEILARGGGILSTVRHTRQASREELLAAARANLDTMLLHGTTTAEVKSGYGLTVADELKQLRVIRELDTIHPVDLVPTFMGAHAFPPEYQGDREGYVDLVCREMLPAVAREGLARYGDVFCEDGVFTVDQSRRILLAGKQMGLQPKIHADELSPLGGAELAAELGAVSADHLLYASEEGLRQMAARGVVAVLLPGTLFSLRVGRYADARRMMDLGVSVALATDFNPGSCPTGNMQFIMTLACLGMGMTPEETITAATINAARAIGMADQVGSIQVGKKADLIILNAPNYEYFLYHFGVNRVDTVIKGGRVVVAEGRILYG